MGKCYALTGVAAFRVCVREGERKKIIKEVLKKSTKIKQNQN